MKKIAETPAGSKRCKQNLLHTLRHAPSQLDWLTVKYNYGQSGQLSYRDVTKKLSDILEVPFTKKIMSESGWVLSCPEAGVYIQLTEENFIIQFQGTYFAFAQNALQELRSKLRSISDFTNVPFYFTRLDISRDFYFVEIKDLTKKILKSDTAQNLGRASMILSKQNLDVIETLQFKTQKRTIQFYRKDIQLLSVKEGSAYFAEYEARHLKATGKKVGEIPWTRYELRINDAPALVPFLKWFSDDKISYAELISLALQHYHSKLYVRPNNGDSNTRRRPDCKIWEAICHKNKNLKWVNVMGALKKNDLRMTPVKDNVLRKFEGVVKNMVRHEVDIEKARDMVVPIGLKFAKEFKDVPKESTLENYAKTYAYLKDLSKKRP